MKKLLLAAAFTGVIGSSAFAQNYISGIVSLYGDNTASGSTIVAPGASFFLYKNKFYEQAGFINHGDSVAISADSGTLVLSGTAAQTLTGRFKISSIQLTNSNGAVITTDEPITMVTILDSVNFGNISNTVFNAGDGLLTLRSTAFKTARIADLTHNDVNTGNAVNGRVIAERYLRSRRAWRLLGPPTTADSANDQTIKQAWQEGATATYGTLVNPNPGYGTVITKPGSNPPAATGYDDGIPASSIYSLYSYTSNGLFTNPLNTDLTHFSHNAAYMLFVRGDRSVPPQLQTNTYSTPSNITTLRSKGALHNGNVTDTLTNVAGAFAGVANPYASAVDFRKVGLNGITNGFYTIDPSINKVGGWVYIDGSDNYTATPLDPGATTSYNDTTTNAWVQSGQAILVKTIGNTGTITFKESNKNMSSGINGFRQMPLPSVHLYLYSGDSSHVFMDGTTAVFDPSFSKEALPDEDVYKPQNVNENLSFYEDNNYLIKDKWTMPAPGDTLPLRLWKTSAKKYQITVNSKGLASAPQPYLLDNYLHASTAIPTNGSANYNFELTQDAASQATDRFAVVFEATVLPVTLVRINADLENDGVAVQWKVSNENGTVSYDIERSVDGGSVFSKIGSTPSHGNNLINDAYDFLDQKPLEGDNYYRVRMIDLNGRYKYTNVVKVTKATEILTVSVYPNPVINQLMKVNFSHSPAGRYLIALYASDGKQIIAKTITHPGGAATYKVPLSKVAQGLYHVTITQQENNKKIINLKVVIE